MYYYENPNLYGYMYYPNYYGSIPYYPVYSNCSKCKSNYAYFGTHEKHNYRNENTSSNANRVVDLQEQKFIPKEFSISYPYLLKTQPIIVERPPMAGPGGQGNQAPPRPPAPGPGGQGNQAPPRPPAPGPGGQGNQTPPRPPAPGPGGQGNQTPPRPPAIACPTLRENE